jgi:hypothetical protein
MIGDDLEADVGGAMAAGLAGVLVRTGKYRQEAVTACVTPTAIVDSVEDVPRLLMRMLPAFGAPRGRAAHSDTRTAVRTAVTPTSKGRRKPVHLLPPNLVVLIKRLHDAFDAP